jgi:hypothetical protein
VESSSRSPAPAAGPGRGLAAAELPAGRVVNLRPTEAQRAADLEWRRQSDERRRQRQQQQAAAS